MNANELADCIEDMDSKSFVSKAVTMLRQQQARIEELEKAQEYLVPDDVQIYGSEQ
jgi:hypothetical protein